MIYIASAFISLFITSALIIALVWCNYQYKGINRSLINHDYADNFVKHIVIDYDRIDLKYD